MSHTLEQLLAVHALILFQTLGVMAFPQFTVININSELICFILASVPLTSSLCGLSLPFYLT